MIHKTKNQTERKLKVIRTNNEEEYMIIDVFLDHEDVVHERSLAYSYELNELVERLNRTLRIIIRDMLTSSDLSLSI
jgi:hypothetical protein